MPRANPSRLQRHTPFAALVALAWMILAPVSLRPQQIQASEDRVKAAYLYNFGRYVRWPAVPDIDQDHVFPICVFDHDPFGATLDSTLTGESLNGKHVAIRRIQKPREAAQCRVLFIGAAQSDHLSEILSALDQLPVLTVSDMDDFSRRGGMIQFVLEGGRVRFDVNLKTAQSARLALNSELLRVAVTVTGSTGPGI
jgi:YfiR/HmsC-like